MKYPINLNLQLHITMAWSCIIIGRPTYVGRYNDLLFRLKHNYIVLSLFLYPCILLEAKGCRVVVTAGRKNNRALLLRICREKGILADASKPPTSIVSHSTLQEVRLWWCLWGYRFQKFPSCFNSPQTVWGMFVSTWAAIICALWTHGCWICGNNWWKNLISCL